MFKLKRYFMQTVSNITGLKAREIFDSRGNPTV